MSAGRGDIKRSMRIGQLARAADVHVETIRYYQRQGLMPTPARPQGGIRRYTEADLARLRFIRRAKAVGFSLTEIRALLRLNDDAGDAAACRAVRALASDKLADIRHRIAELSRMAEALETLIHQCDGSADPACPIIQTLAGDAGD